METEDKYSLRGRVFNAIRDDIINGKFKNGQELKENALAEMYGVSRTPVREALRQLELEGLVSIIPNKGAYVDGISAKDVIDIYEIRSRLEGLCARWATANITESQLDELDENVYLSEFHANKGHFDKVAELDSQFHETLYEASSSRRLKLLLTDYHQYVTAIRRMSISANTRSNESNIEHAAILKAMREKNADLAEELAHQHIIKALESAMDNGLRKMLEKEK